MRSEKKKILILSVSGIGNTIMQSPMINSLARQENLVVDVLFQNRTGSAVYAHDQAIRTRYLLPDHPLGALPLIRTSRRNRYDYSVCGFPSNLVELNLFPFLVGARRRVTHSYSVGKWRTLNFLSNVKIVADTRLHDVEQNLQLLNVFNLKIPSRPQLTFSMAAANHEFARQFVKTFDSRPILGIHPGSGPLRQKRWPQERFLSLAARLKHTFNIIIFGTPGETAAFQPREGVHVCRASLNDTAALICRCDRFLSADTGLMHIAAACGVRQVVLWGPTAYSRTRPWSERAVVLGRTDLDCLQYPFYDTKSRFNCPAAGQYMAAITVDEVIAAICQ